MMIVFYALAIAYVGVGIHKSIPHFKEYFMSKKIADERSRTARIGAYGKRHADDCRDEANWWYEDAKKAKKKAFAALLWKPKIIDN